jgi:hypothetical protein
MFVAYFLSSICVSWDSHPPGVWRYELCQLLELWGVSPTLAQSPCAEGDEHPDREHLCIAFGLRGGIVEERADTGILFVDEVPGARQQERTNNCRDLETYTRSSVTLCSPEGSDLYSTTPSTSTIHGTSQSRTSTSVR